MADIELVIKIPEEVYKKAQEIPNARWDAVWLGIKHGTLLPKGHGRLGDLDELEQRINNFVEHDAKITDEYTVIRERVIVDGIRDTPTVIEADKEASDTE